MSRAFSFASHFSVRRFAVSKLSSKLMTSALLILFAALLLRQDPADAAGATTTTAPVTQPTSQPTSQPTVTQLPPRSPRVVIRQGTAVFLDALDIDLPAGTTPLTARYRWQFDKDSSHDLVGWNVAHVYSRAGNQTVTLTVTDVAGDRFVRKQPVIVVEDSRPSIIVSDFASLEVAVKQPGARVLISGMIDQPRTLNPADDVSIEAAPNFTPPPTNPTTSPATRGATDPNTAGLFWTGGRKYASMINGKNLVVRGLTFDSVFAHDDGKDGLPTAVHPS